MNYLKITINGFFAIMLLHSCVTPNGSINDSARMLKENEVEIQAEISTNVRPDAREVTRYGGRVGLGLSDKVNLKGRYYFGTDGSQSAQIDFKFSDRPNKLAFSFPLSYSTYGNDLAFSENFFGTRVDETDYYGKKGYWSTNPRMYINLLNPNRQLDLNVIPNFHILGTPENFGFNFVPAINMSIGYQTKDDRFNIRAEYGLAAAGGFMPLPNFGFGISYKIFRK